MEKKEFMYVGKCPKCKIIKRAAGGMGVSVKKNFKLYCEDCDLSFEPKNLAELNVVNKKVVSKPISIGVLSSG